MTEEMKLLIQKHEQVIVLLKEDFQIELEKVKFDYDNEIKIHLEEIKSSKIRHRTECKEIGENGSHQYKKFIEIEADSIRKEY